MKITSTLASFTLISCMAFAPLAHAKNDSEKYAKRVAEAKITLVDAVTKANANTPGTPIEVDLDTDFGKVVYDVVIFNEGKRTKVTVNAQDGTIMKTAVKN